MWELYLKWLPTFGLILGGVILLSGLTMGMYRAFRRIYDYSHDRLFIIPEKKLSFKVSRKREDAALSYHLGVIPGLLLAGGIIGISGGL